MNKLKIKNIILKYQKKLFESSGFIISVWDILAKQEQNFLLKKQYIKELIYQEPELLDAVIYIEKYTWKKFDSAYQARMAMYHSVMDNVVLSLSINNDIGSLGLKKSLITDEQYDRKVIAEQEIERFKQSQLVKDYIYLMTADIEEYLHSGQLEEFGFSFI